MVSRLRRGRAGAGAGFVLAALVGTAGMAGTARADDGEATQASALSGAIAAAPRLAAEDLRQVRPLGAELTDVAPADAPVRFGALLPQARIAPADEIVVEDRALTEERRVGSYGQPEWTTHRRFARSRLYVLPEGTLEFEQWYRGRIDRGEGPRHQFQSEIGIGLPNRIQLDLYETAEHEAGGPTKHVGFQFEARWALANWGELWGNPTLYAEYKLNHHGNDVAEGKVLFGDEFGSGWHWAMNLSGEQELGGAREFEGAITGALSYSVVDQVFSVGVEAEVQRVTEKGARSDPEYNVFLGPSLQWRPTPNTHVDLVPLFGLRDDDIDMTLFLIFGIDLGGAEEQGVHAPAASRNR